jgi:proteasome lid subunit RPN8/RPN11
MSTIIDNSVLKDIQFRLESDYPNEGCGFLFGKDDQRIRHITQMIAADNQSTGDQRRQFVIHPHDYLKAERYAQKNDLQLLGIFHSHPDHPAIPSTHDLEFAQPYFSYFIHSIQKGKFAGTRSYRLINGQLLEEKFSIRQITKTI